MKNFTFYILLTYLNQYVLSEDILDNQKFNFPLEVNNSNTIYLNEYSKAFDQAPHYSIQSNNQFNLKIDQSISHLFKMNQKQQIKIGSNFIAQSGVYSNEIWALTQDQMLLKGQIDRNGEIKMTQFDFKVSQECFQISQIANDILMLSCINNHDLSFLILNTINLESTEFIVDYSIQSEYKNPNIQIISVNNTSFTFCLIYTTQISANMVYFIYDYDYNDIEKTKEQKFEGMYKSAILSEYYNFLFLVSNNNVHFVDLTLDSNIQNIKKQQVLNPDAVYPIQQISMYQIQTYVFHFVILQNKILTSFLFDINFRNQNALKRQFGLKEYNQILRLEVIFYNIYIITDTYILTLISKDSITSNGYQLLNSGNYAFLQPLRNIVVVQDQIHDSSIISTYLINQPQIFISKDVTKQIESQGQPEQIEILVIFQLSPKKNQFTFSIQLILIDITQNQQPILFQRKLDPSVFQYPEQEVMQKGKIFYGPNLKLSVKSSEEHYLQSYKMLNFLISYPTLQTIYQVGCLFIQSEQILCSQFINKTILISDSNSKQMYWIYTKEELIKCTCVKSISEVNVIMQFQNTIFVQQFNLFMQHINFIEIQNQLDIVGATILKENLFIISINGELTAKSLLDQQTLFTISNLKINQIYTNLINYPNYLFLETLSELIIIAYNGKQSYQIVNFIPYPIKQYINIGIGILEEGIYFAFLNKGQSFLYFYPKMNIYIQNNLQNYYQIYLDDFQIYQANVIFSIYSSNSFFMIMQKENLYYINQYQATGTSYNALKNSKSFLNAAKGSILQLSSIIQNEIKYEIEIIFISTNSYTLIERAYFTFDFMFATHYAEDDHIKKQLYLNYAAENENTTLSIQQNVTIIYESNLLIGTIIDDKQVYNIEDNAQIQINPQKLFFGNIQNYTATCNECKSFKFTQPINELNSLTINFDFHRIVNQYDLIYITDQNHSLYQFDPKINKLSLLYSFPFQNDQICQALFIEMYTLFPVQICSGKSTSIYAFNISSNELITYNFLEINQYYSSDYNNGILQLFTLKERNQNYFAFYFLISNNQINVIQFYDQMKVCEDCFVDFLYLSMSQNFTTQPCQIFGFIVTDKSGSGDNIIFSLKNCMPPKISQMYGFVSNQTTSSGNIYFTKSIWKLKEKQYMSFPFFQSTMQFGFSKEITEIIIEAKFIVSQVDAVDLYLILFNSTSGELLSFVKDQSFYLACNPMVQLCLLNKGADGLLLIQSYQNDGYLISQIYSYQDHQPEINSQKMNRILGFEKIQLDSNNSLQHAKLSGNYFIVGNPIHSQLFYVQNYLTFEIDVQDIENSQIDIIAYNPSKQVKQSFNVKNQNYKAKSQRITLWVVYCFLIIFILGLLIVPRYFMKQKQQLHQAPLSYELIDK